MRLARIALVATLFGVLAPPASLAQRVAPAPLPPVYYTAQAGDAAPTEQQAEADVGKEEDKGELGFLDKDLSEISRTQVTSPALSSEIETVSRTTQPLARTPSAVYVVTSEMIRRCGARNVPEVLRTVPGVQVARINASAWAISIRGFTGRFSNKLLVQVDGVAIYNLTQGAVFWEREYVMLENIDRIEVIRGPGAAVWGVNAVNGVINIVTKAPKDTKGVYVDGGGGNQHREFGNLRVGGRSGNLHWWMYGMTMEDDQGYIPLPQIASDGPRLDQGGFRVDWTPTCCDTITIQGDFYGGEDNAFGAYTPPAAQNPLNCSRTTLLTRWAREIDDDTDWTLQVYYYNPHALGVNLNTVSTFDLDFQHHRKRGRHDFVWGFGYRNSYEHWRLGGFFVIEKLDNEQIPSYFLQDTVTLVEDRLYVTLGSKFDHNSVTRFEYQPTVRVAWTPDERTSIWGAVSRASRIPSLYERVNVTPLGEDVLAYEAGIRRQPTDKLYWELATFFNRYDDLLGSQAFFTYENVGEADTYGFEFNATYEVNERWRLLGSYSFLVEDVDYPAGYSPQMTPGTAPRNMAYLQSSWDLGNNVSFDMMFRYMDTLPMGVNNYFAGDIRLAWRPARHLELSVVGQNLYAGNHYEFVNPGGVIPTEIEPGVYGMISWRY